MPTSTDLKAAALSCGLAPWQEAREVHVMIRYKPERINNIYCSSALGNLEYVTPYFLKMNTNGNLIESSEKPVYIMRQLFAYKSK